MRSILTYASETWPLTLRDEEALEIFERKILRCILGVLLVNGSWRRRSNLELYKIYKQPNIVNCVKLQRLKWTSHLARMNEDRCYKNIFPEKPMGNRPRGSSPLRWIDCVEKDLKRSKTGKQLPKVEMPGENFWRRPVTTNGLSSH
ncbi:putative endonuclease-reverse transcriptase [Trichonephila clavipes]|nr:putative endonuclease-reverse transcriptase [Trichonephila clavipes]